MNRNLLIEGEHEMLRKILLSVFVFVAIAYPAAAAVVHHCTYDPWTITQEIHERHSGSGCSNMDDNEEGHSGECFFQNIFFWSDMVCDSNGCRISGKVDCPGGDKTYYFDCPGANARAYQTRTWADCEANSDGEGTHVSHTCTCNYGCS